ncbi:hypothetical protein [Streptomyces sp. NPDC050507]|uniref:hypothetical protein n=1 Tax=Streptomyces sp. NPDC050507 TaxID=3365619 RepID=UPI0037909695
MRLTFGADRFAALATDCYTVGSDWCPIDPGTVRGVHTVWIERDAAKAIAAAAKKDRVPRSRAPYDSDGRGRGTFAYFPGDALVYTPHLEGAEVSAQDKTNRVGPRMTPAGVVAPDRLWDACEELFEVLDDRPAHPPDVITLNPDYLGRLAKVETPGKELRVASFLMRDPDRQILVKIGTRFMGAVMAVDPEVPLENGAASQDQLW